MSPPGAGMPPWVNVDSTSSARAAASPSSSRGVGLGFSTADMSNTMRSPTRQGGAALGVFATPSSFGERENRHPRSPPRIRTTSISTVIPTTLSPGTSSDSSPTKRSHLRVEPRLHTATAPSRRTASPLFNLFRAIVPKRIVPRALFDSPPLVYPKSPSLSRPHPVTRHGHSSRRIFTPRRALCTLMLVAILVVLYATSSNDARERLMHRWRATDAAGQRSLVGQVRAPGPVNYGAVLEEMRGGARGTPAQEWAARDAAQHEMEKRPRPHRAAAKVDEAPRPEPVAPNKVEVVKEKDEDTALPFVAEPAVKDASAGDAVERPEDEQAGLEAVVKQAQKEALRAEVELDEKLEMEKVAVKEKKPPLRVKNKADKVVDSIVNNVPPEAEAKAEAAVAKAVAIAKKKAADPKKKDASRYKRLLPMGVPPRRHLYGANFVLSADDLDSHTEVEDPELTNAMVKVPSAKQLKRLFDQGKKRYVEDADDWRAFEWKAPPADASLQRLVEKLKPEERALRSWIQELHKLPKGQGLGLGAPSSGAEVGVSTLDDAPTFNRGSRDKWSDLIVQAREGHAGKCTGAKWLKDYEKMHTEMLAGKREPKFISYHCEQGMNCGGLGDRLLGMTSAFFFGLVTQRAFLAEWQSPVPLDIVFDSPHVNWSHSSYTADQHPILGHKRLAASAAELDIIHFDRLSVDATFGTVSWNPKLGRKPTLGFERRDLAYASPWIKFYTNRGMIYRSFKYKHLQKSLDRLGLQPTTAFACISEYLFKPKPPALDLITQYTSVLALPTVFSVGIHIRTGDQSMRDAEYDKVNTVKRHISFFRCARELGETYARKDQRVVFYLVTDSAHLKQDAHRVLGNKLITTDMVPQHVHQKSGHVDGVMNAVVEDWILAKADMLVATQDSGFGKLASFMMAKPNATVTIFPRFNPDVMGLLSKKSHVKVDCTSPTVFTTFEELSSEWSLG